MIQETRRGGAIIPVKEPIILSDPFKGPSLSLRPSLIISYVAYSSLSIRGRAALSTRERYIRVFDSVSSSSARSFPTTNGHTRRQDGKKHLFRLIALCPPDTFDERLVQMLALTR